MKKNILFIIPGLGAGGAEKSLVNLLNEFDYSKYNVDLFVIDKKGLFTMFLPEQVKVLEQPENLIIFKESLLKSIGIFISKRKFKLAYNRLAYCFINKFMKNKGKAEQYSWKFFRQAIGIIDRRYDISIGYLEKTSNYICVDCVETDKKIGWIHNDYTKLEIDREFDEKYFNKLDFVVTVSDKCKEVLEKEFPQIKIKVKLIENITSSKLIRKLACKNEERFDSNRDEIKILSIGRLDNQKGFDMAIEAANLLVQKGYKIKWNIIGEGNERKKLQELIKKYNLQNNFNLIGLRANPYPYISNCDIYVQPSRFEGKSVAIDEAKILCKPIVVTNFSTVYDQITNNKTGIITGMNALEISKGIEKYINDIELKNSMICNLKRLSLGNEFEIKKVYSLFK